MCEIKQNFDKATGNLDITCVTSGKPIAISNKHGMFCEDLCEMEISEELEPYTDKLVNALVKSKGELNNDISGIFKDIEGVIKKHGK